MTELFSEVHTINLFLSINISQRWVKAYRYSLHLLRQTSTHSFMIYLGTLCISMMFKQDQTQKF